MSRGKFLSLEEARQSGMFKRFCAEHAENADRRRFLALLTAMSQGALEAGMLPKIPPELELAELLSEAAARHVNVRARL